MASFTVRENCLSILKKLTNVVATMDDEILDDIHGALQCILARAQQPVSKVPGKRARGSCKRRKMADDNNETAEECDMPSIKDFSEKILLQIMSHFNLTDRKNTRLVSKQWHRLSYDAELVKNDWTNIRASEYLTHTSANSRHVNVQVQERDSLMETLPFWEKHGEHIKAIEFKSYMKSDDHALPAVLRLCPNVERISMSLTASDSFGARISFPVVPLKNLEVLHLRLDCGGAGRIVGSLFAHAPKLKEIAAVIPTECEEAQDAVFSVLLKHPTTLEELDVREFVYEDIDLIGITQVVGPQLKRLHLENTTRLTYCGLISLYRHFVNLEHLTLNCANFDTWHVWQAVVSMKNLTHLALNGINLSGEYIGLFVAIDKWSKLIALDLRDTKVTADNLKFAFKSPHPNLLNLQLDGSALALCYGSSFLNEICPKFPNLLAFGLHRSYLEDEDIEIIARHVTLLEDLSFSFCRGWHCSALNGFEKLKHLSLAKCEKSLDTLASLCLPALHTIDLRYTGATSFDILQLLEKNPLLHQVTVSNNVISDNVQCILRLRQPKNPCKRYNDTFTRLSLSLRL